MRLGDLDHLLLKLDAELSDDARYIEIANQIRDIIDNAPTVEEVSVIEFKEPLPLVKAQKIVKALSKRPQGEWINKKVVSCGKILRLGANVTECQCPKCKRWCIKWADAFDYKNCPHCGASMKKGDAE